MSEFSMQEVALRNDIQPFVVDAYEKYMTRGGVRIDDAVHPEQGTIYPMGVICEAVGEDPEMGITPKVAEAMRTSFDDHISAAMRLGVNLRPALGTSLRMNLGTEDNTVHYYDVVKRMAAGNSELEKIAARWITEEAFHGDILFLYNLLAGVYSPADQHRIKASQHSKGLHLSSTELLIGTLGFSSPQEDLTVVAHRNTDSISDLMGQAVMKPIEGDEARHYTLFTDLLAAAMQLYPDYVLPILARVWRRFVMPGKEGIDKFEEEALQIAAHGLFTLAMVRASQQKVADRLKIDKLEPKTSEGQKAQKEIMGQVLDMSSRLNRHVQGHADKWADEYIRTEKAAGRIPVILGHTVVVRPIPVISTDQSGKQVITTAKKLEVFPEAA